MQYDSYNCLVFAAGTSNTEAEIALIASGASDLLTRKQGKKKKAGILPKTLLVQFQEIKCPLKRHTQKL